MKKRTPVWVIEVTWKRRKGKPVEHVMLMTGGLLALLFVPADIAKQLKVPQSWVSYRAYDGRKDVGLRAAHKKLLAQKNEEVK